MPLVIAIVVIIYLFISTKEQLKSDKKKEAYRAAAFAKTNATLERELFDKYLKEGHPVGVAHGLSQDEIVRRGFVPCIPKSAYWNGIPLTQNGGVVTSKINISQYDSSVVRDCREKLRKNGIELTDENLYADFPTNYNQQEKWIRKQTLIAATRSDGDIIMHPKYGACRITGHRYGRDYYSGVYIVDVLSDGTKATILIDDDSIRNIGSKRNL